MTLPEQDRFDRVLEHLYKAALADAEWVSAAASINDMIRTNGHSLTYAGVGVPGGQPEIHLARFFVGPQRRRDYEQTYFRDYYPRDEAIPRLHGLRDGEMESTRSCTACWPGDRPDDSRHGGRAGLRGKHRADAPEAGLPQAGNPQTDRARAEGSVAGWPAKALPVTRTTRGDPFAEPCLLRVEDLRGPQKRGCGWRIASPKYLVGAHHQPTQTWLCTPA